MGFIGKQPAKAAITSSDITDGVVTADKLASDSVTTAKIADNGVTTAKINADAVTDAKIADDVVGSEHLTAGEVDTTALGADAVTAAKIADDAISDEHLDVTAITGQTAETSVATDDLILISDTSASGALKKMTRANFVSGVGETNLPAFYAELSSQQDTDNGSTRKVNLNNVVLDTASGWDSSNYKWTVPSGEGGKYFISASVNSRSSDNNAVAWCFAKIYINNTEYEVGGFRTANNQSNYIHEATSHVSVIRTLSASDYVELYGITYAGGTPRFGTELSSLKIFKVAS